MTYKKGSKEAKEHMAKVRASKVSGVKKKVAKKKVSPRKKAVAKKKVNISYEDSWGKYLDSNKQALPRGKRISKPQYYADGSLRNQGGKIYYENRLNHADVKQKAKKGQMLGTKSPRLSIINNKKDIINKLDQLVKYNIDIESYLIKQKERLKNDKSSYFILNEKKYLVENIKKYTNLLKSNKQYLIQLKKAL